MTMALEASAALEAPELLRWYRICSVTDLLPGRGACALVDSQQIAVFRLADGRVFAVGNHDPYSQAYVISRGLVGSRGDAPTVASPLHKHVFDLRDGTCLDDPSGPGLRAYDVHVDTDGSIQIGLPTAAPTAPRQVALR